MNTVLLSRGQFALTIAFHFIFPPITIGLGLILVVMQGMRLRTGNALYTGMAHFWTKIFGLIFAIGVATGIPMEFQFGTNWANYARFVGDIFGSPLAIEGVYAFFLESGFLAILLFGWNKVGPKMHFLATFLVALGAHFSAIWIIVANSWMQTPAGYHLARMVKEIASGQQFPMSADLGNAAFTVKEIPLPAGYIVQPIGAGRRARGGGRFREGHPQSEHARPARAYDHRVLDHWCARRRECERLLAAARPARAHGARVAQDRTGRRRGGIAPPDDLGRHHGERRRAPPAGEARRDRRARGHHRERADGDRGRRALAARFRQGASPGSTSGR